MRIDTRRGESADACASHLNPRGSVSPLRRGVFAAKRLGASRPVVVDVYYRSGYAYERVRRYFRAFDGDPLLARVFLCLEEVRR